MTFTPSGGQEVWGLGSYDAPELRFNGIDGDGVEWVLGPVDGWRATPAQLPVLDSPGDGGWFGVGRRPVRPLTLSGAFRAPTRELLDVAEARLRAAAAVVDRDQVLWAGETIPKQVTVRQSGPCIVDPTSSRRVRTFSVVLTAADPYRYAAGAAGLVEVDLFPQGTAGGGMTFPLRFPLSLGGARNRAWAATTNPGDTAVSPTLRIDGPLRASVTVQQVTTNEFFGVTGDLAAGTSAVSQFRYSNLLIDGQSARGRRLPGSTYWRIQPGRNDLHLLIDAASSAADLSPATRAVLTYRPAWR